MRGAVTLLAAAMLLGACAGAAPPEETAPPPTPLPSLRAPIRSLEPTASPDPVARQTADPESALQQLLASLPPALASRCQREAPPRGAIASVDCRPASGADRASFLLFDDGATMLGAYGARLDRLPADALDGAGCGRGPGSERLKNGRRACYRDGGSATVLWTNDLASVLASASRQDGDWAALEAFWRDAGPITP